MRVLLVHDVLPEVFGWDMSKGEWRQKSRAVAAASAVVAVSRHTARSFLRAYASYPTASSAGGDDASLGRRDSSRTMPRAVLTAHNGVDTTIFRPRTVADACNDHQVVNTFRGLAGLDPATPYVMIVGSRHGYKNARAAYRALGLATTPTFTSARSSDEARISLAIVLVGGGPVVPEEAELLAELGRWSHVGAGSGVPGGGTDAVNDSLLAEGYSGAVALLHLSLGEGFGLTVLEAFACGCPVIAADIPPVREIAGLPDLGDPSVAEASRVSPVSPASTLGEVPAVPSSARPLPEASREVKAKAATTTAVDDGPPAPDGADSFGDGGGDTASSGERDGGRYDGGSFSLEGGLVLIENPASATQIWRAVRAVAAMGLERRAKASEALVRRAKVFGSWQPLAETLIKAAVED